MAGMIVKRFTQESDAAGGKQYAGKNYCLVAKNLFRVFFLPPAAKEKRNSGYDARANADHNIRSIIQTF